MLVLAFLLAQLQPLPPQLVPLDSDEGRAIFAEARASRAFFPLVSRFTTQRSTSYCGVASSLMVLNALDLAAPEAREWAPFRAFTDENVFNAEARRAVTPASVEHGGLTLEQLSHLLRSNGAEVTPVHAEAGSLDAFRREAAADLAAPGRYVLVDFLRTELGQDFGAHWSPLAAYSEKTDRFLVLDVARFRYPPSWARAEDLWRAMATRDLDSGHSRGYLRVAKAAGAPARAEVPAFGHRLLRYAAGAASVVFALGAIAGALFTRWRLRRRPAGGAAAGGVGVEA